MSAYSGHHLHVGFGKQFSDDGKTGFAPRARQHFQAFLAEPLEFIR